MKKITQKTKIGFKIFCRSREGNKECGGEGEGEKALQFKSELLRGVFGEEGEERGAELVVGRFVGEAKWCCRRQQIFLNNKFDGSAVTALI